MKQLFALLLALILLSGCGVTTPGTTDPIGGADEIQSTTGPALYDGTHPIEADTQGAVRVFEMPEGCEAVATVGENVLLFFGDAIRSYSGENLNLVKELSLQTQELPSYPDVQINEDAMGYYDEVNHTVVILNGALKEIAKVKLPSGAQGGFALADTLDTLYYCTEDSVRALNLKTGNSHMVRQHGDAAQALVQKCFGGDILGCEVYSRDQRYVAYISTETGALLGTDKNATRLLTGGSYYFAEVSDGNVKEFLFGKVGEVPQSLHPAAAECSAFEALAMSGVFTAFRTDDGLKLDYYDLDSGKRTASVVLEGAGNSIHSSWADKKSNCLWLLIQNESGENVLCRWDLNKSPTGDDRIYTAPRFTAEHPDTEGLSQCAAEAAALGSKYGMEIRIGNAPDGCRYGLTDEHQVSVIKSGLAALDQALSRYPAPILEAINKVSGSGKVTITLVRTIDAERVSCQYWSGNDACIALELADDMTGRLDNAMYHVLDTFLFNNTSGLDQWDELNPKGFEYDMNETDFLNRQDDKYLTGEKQAFVDSFAMSYPMEDRARIFEYALREDAAEAFASDTMQNKLETLCKAIRNAFGWKKSEETYVWEQHLEESLAYIKKK